MANHMSAFTKGGANDSRHHWNPVIAGPVDHTRVPGHAGSHRCPIASIVVLVFSQAPLLPANTEIFMPAMAGFIGNFFPVFLTGAIFGMLMTVTGYAKSIATSLIGGRAAIAATVVT